MATMSNTAIANGIKLHLTQGCFKLPPQAATAHDR
jgi:hypothetical protein